MTAKELEAFRLEIMEYAKKIRPEAKLIVIAAAPACATWDMAYINVGLGETIDVLNKVKDSLKGKL